MLCTVCGMYMYAPPFPIKGKPYNALVIIALWQFPVS